MYRYLYIAVYATGLKVFQLKKIDVIFYKLKKKFKIIKKNSNELIIMWLNLKKKLNPKANFQLKLQQRGLKLWLSED